MHVVQRTRQVKGVGPWTVDMFMMFSLHRPDVVPVGDLGVRKGMQAWFGLKALPPPVQMLQLAAPWAPYRSAPRPPASLCVAEPRVCVF